MKAVGTGFCFEKKAVGRGSERHFQVRFHRLSRRNQWGRGG